jgi:hypothetical protein
MQAINMTEMSGRYKNMRTKQTGSTETPIPKERVTGGTGRCVLSGDDIHNNTAEWYGIVRTLARSVLPVPGGPQSRMPLQRMAQSETAPCTLTHQ